MKESSTSRSTEEIEEANKEIRDDVKALLNDLKPAVSKCCVSSEVAASETESRCVDHILRYCGTSIALFRRQEKCIQWNPNRFWCYRSCPQRTVLDKFRTQVMRWRKTLERLKKHTTSISTQKVACAENISLRRPISSCNKRKKKVTPLNRFLPKNR